MEVSGQISYAASTFQWDRNSWYWLNMRLGLPLNQSKCCVEMKNLTYWRGIWTGFLARNLVTIPHIHINTFFIYLFGCLIGQHVGRNQRRFWQQPQNRTGHRLNSIMQCQLPMHSPLLCPIIQHVPTIMMMKVDGRCPKSVLKLEWKVTEV
jgi:hypothetical protein